MTKNEFIDWIADDITFCGSPCENKCCARHPSNMRNKTGLHTFALLADTELCPVYKDKNTKGTMAYERRIAGELRAKEKEST